MTNFAGMTKNASRRATLTEDIDRPWEDQAQEAWLGALTTLHRRGILLPDAKTSDELMEHYGDNAGMFVTALSYQMARRTPASERPRLFAELSEMELESIDADDQSYEQIEGRDELERRIADLSPSARKAVERFVLAWTLQEQGYKLPNALSQQIHRDRKRFGLPLRLQRRRGRERGNHNE